MGTSVRDLSSSYFLKFAIALTCLGAIPSCQAVKPQPNTGGTECVGRMQFDLPGPAEVAATTKSDLKRRMSPRPSSFLDGQPAYLAGLIYGGDLEVVHGLSRAELDAFIARRGEVRDQFRADSKSRISVGKSPAEFRELSAAPQDGIGFEAQGHRFLSLRFGDQALSWTGFTGLSESKAQKDYLRVLQGLKPRATFQIPSEAGVCVPYGFIQDEGNEARGIRVAYRLLEHPDITVLLQDASAASRSPGQVDVVKAAQYRIDDFWSQYSAGMTGLTSHWKPAYRSVKLAEQPGLESFVRFFREVGVEDYGYFAVAPGDHEAKGDIPDLVLYVIRDAEKAKTKGIAPMSKSAFLDLAEGIAASVKRRVTSQ
jgi:hypothetical protein